MNEGIYLFVYFDWPKQITDDVIQGALQLHKLTNECDWIKESIAASDGVGSEFSSVWVFWLENYGALDKLFRDKDNEINQVYTMFFTKMRKVKTHVKEKVIFR
jgi:hypothetical protein